ncbi:hypothetical protein LCGC14_1173560, partial [marine sediment metagenome]
MDRNLDFNTIYEEFQQKILHYVTRMVGPSDAEGVTQETFIKVSRSLDTFKGDSKLSTWIYRIATNTALDRIKSAANKYPHEEFEPGVNVEAETKDAWTGQEKPAPEHEHVRKEMNQCIR